MKIFACTFLIIAIFGFASSQFTELQPSEYEDNQTILNSLNFGASHLMRDAVERDVLPDGDYEIILVNKVEQEFVSNGTNWRFNVEIAGPNNAHVEGNVTVFYASTTGENEIAHFYYSYYYNVVGSNDGEDDGESLGVDEDDFSWEWFDFEEDKDGDEQWDMNSDFLPIN